MLKYSTYRSIYEMTPRVDTIEKRSAFSRLNASLFRKAYLIKLMMIVMLVVSGFTVVGNVFASSISAVKHQEKEIVVERGDTLWSIALSNKPSGMRTVVYIEGIRQYNGLTDTSIQAGDILSLPIY
ncbi:MAG: LysM peptidoglycan-binding domain-containing protein [Paenibacillus sp.]|nr:LysM peptidoglycan-binding domain-containing protein [Paenibacillus sp.]